MKKIFAILLMVTMLLSLAACGSTSNEPEIKPDSASSAVDSNTQAEADATPDTSVPSSSETSTEPSGDNSEPSDSGSRVLIAYFSATGTTKKIAEYAADAASADLYEIVPAEPYTADDLNYNVSNCRANAEMNDPSSRPEISGGVTNMADYDIVFIGYPIWWGEAPAIVYTFTEHHSFEGKTVIPFATSYSSPLGDSGENLFRAAKTGTWLPGECFTGGGKTDDVLGWIHSLKK